MTLPRDVLKWIQHLELENELSCPARDLANGFVVGNILSKYFASDAKALTLDSGMNTGVRESNWGKLAEFLTKKGMNSLSNECISDIIHYKNDAAVSFLIDLHSALEGGEHSSLSLLNQKRAGRPWSEVPNYARATASFKVKNPEIARTADDMQRRMKAAGALLQHELDCKVVKSLHHGESKPIIKQEHCIVPNKGSSVTQRVNSMEPMRPLSVAEVPRECPIVIKSVQVRCSQFSDFSSLWEEFQRFRHLLSDPSVSVDSVEFNSCLNQLAEIGVIARSPRSQKVFQDFLLLSMYNGALDKLHVALPRLLHAWVDPKSRKEFCDHFKTTRADKIQILLSSYFN